MTGLTEFLLERVAEAEAEAQKVIHGWLDYDPATTMFGPFASDERTHLEVGPARVLAECEAKRKLLEMHEGARNALSIIETILRTDPDNDRLGSVIVQAAVATSEAALRIHAAVYADHPSYDPTWQAR